MQSESVYMYLHFDEEKGAGPRGGGGGGLLVRPLLKVDYNIQCSFKIYMLLESFEILLSLKWEEYLLRDSGMASICFEVGRRGGLQSAKTFYGAHTPPPLISPETLLIKQ